MKVRFSIRGANYTTAVYISPEDRQKDIEWVVKALSPRPQAWVRVVESGGRWNKIIVMPRSDRLHID
jgi:hypothetical protein